MIKHVEQRGRKKLNATCIEENVTIAAVVLASQLKLGLSKPKEDFVAASVLETLQSEIVGKCKRHHRSVNKWVLFTPHRGSKVRPNAD